MTNKHTHLILLLIFAMLAAGIVVADVFFLPLIQQWLAPGQTTESLLIRRGGDEAAFLFVLGLVFGAATVVAFLWWRQHGTLCREKCESDARVQAITDAARDGIVMMDAEGRVSYWNPAAERIFGYTIAEALGQNAHELLAPQRHREAFQAAFPEFQRTGRGAAIGRTLELEARRKNGSEIVIALSLSAMRAGGKWHAVAIVRDITESKGAEKVLLEFKTAVEQSADGIVLTDLDGYVRFVNGAWARMHGCSAEEPIGRHLGMFHTEEQLQAEVNPFNARLLIAGSQEGEIGHVRKDGTVFPTWMSCTLLTDTDGKPFGFIGIARDITEKKRAEKTLKKSEAMLSSILNSVPQSIFWKDRESVFLGCNEVFAKWAGIRPEDIVGKTDFDMPASREEGEAYRADDREVMTTGRPKTHIIEQQHQPDGTSIWLDTTKIPLVDPEGKVYGVLGVYENISERKRMEDELRKAKDAAEDATQIKSQFLANMSHEIRTPMTAILGYADVLNEEVMCCSTCRDSTNCQQRRVGCEAVGAIRRNGQHLLELINDILDLSKIEARKLQVESTPCSPVQVVSEVVSLMHPLAAAKQLNLKTEFVGSLPAMVMTDPLRLRQILVNVVGNAIKFTDQGEVCITVRQFPDATPSQLRFEIADTGIGMSEEQVGRLFEAFTQVDRSSTRRFIGTGLGLCISKLLANALGGDIEVHSAPGQGSTFIVAIALMRADRLATDERPQVIAAEPQPTTVPEAGGKMMLQGRALLAEDGMDNQRLIGLLLRKRGIEVTVVENGQLAVDAVLAAREAGEPFDVVLMDMQMPVLDGYDATRRIRAMHYKGPILALTAHAMREDRQACLNAGCDDYLAKPIEQQRLFETLAKYLSKGPGAAVATGGPLVSIPSDSGVQQES